MYPATTADTTWQLVTTDDEVIRAVVSAGVKVRVRVIGTEKKERVVKPTVADTVTVRHSGRVRVGVRGWPWVQWRSSRVRA